MELLTTKVALPNSLKGFTKGLLGNFDGDANNDFGLPNGKILKNNLSDREIFTEFGEKCEYPINRGYHNNTHHMFLLLYK